MTSGDAAVSRVASAPLRVLFVCEGNVCRSPTAELVLRARAPHGSVVARSAGLRARVGSAVAEDTGRLLVKAGVDPSSFRARALQDDMVRGADLVVVMTAAQRSEVVRRVPSVLRRAWTLLDLQRALSEAGPGALHDLDRLLATRSGSGGDVPDPWGRGKLAHRRAFDAVAGAVDRLASALV